MGDGGAGETYEDGGGGARFGGVGDMGEAY